MKRTSAGGFAVAVLLLAGVAACTGDDGPDTSTLTGGFNMANSRVLNPSDRRGGTLTLAVSSDWDSVDPGNTHDVVSANLSRLYARTLTMARVGAGGRSAQLVGDLAEGLGQPSDGGRTWTYRIRPGLTFADGTPITAEDVAYGVNRSLDKSVLVNGPTYFNELLNLAGYLGPYASKGRPDPAIDTPDDHTIVFHLNRPFADFDHLAALPATAPVPAAKDTGAQYEQHVVSSGPYQFAAYLPGKGFTLVRNPYWDQKDDPNRRALPDSYVVQIGVPAAEIDRQLIAGTLDGDLAGTGVQPDTLPQVLSRPDLKARSDNPATTRIDYTSIDPLVFPLTKKACRAAIEYAADKSAYQQAYGGPLAGGTIATGLLSPLLAAYRQRDVWPDGADHTGDLGKARLALQSCGQPAGFAANIAYRSGRPAEQAVAVALQKSLARVGIRLTLKALPSKDYFARYAGLPSYRAANQLGLLVNTWSGDWADGYGVLSQIVDGRVIQATGGSTNLSVDIPEVNQMIDRAVAEPDANLRNAAWAAIDQRVVEEAVVLPGVWATPVTVRGKRLANVFVSQAFGTYDWTALGLQ